MRVLLVVTFCVWVGLGSNTVKRLGWRVGALATPLCMGILAAPFFGLIVYSGTDFSPDTLATIVAFGAVQGALSKAAKNALFDPTTQMAYIPLDQESRVKGKAAIDVLGSRLGKSGCAFLQQTLVVAFGTIGDAAPTVTLIYYVVIISWLAACFRLAVLFEERSRLVKEKPE